MQPLSRTQYLRKLVATNIQSSMALRGAFLTQLTLMIVNNMIFFVTWIIFFSKVDEIRGWRLEDVAALFGLVATCVGGCVLFGGGMRNIANLIQNGGLDSYMTQPKSLLIRILCSRSNPAGWGDIIAGVFLLGWSGYGVGWNILLFGLFCIGGVAVILASGILTHSLAFWLSNADGLAQQFFEYIVLLSGYPQVAFHWMMKVLIFTVLPAGIISYLPVQILRSFDWWSLLAYLVGCLVHVLLARAVFYRGLRRYESGNQFEVHAA